MDAIFDYYLKQEIPTLILCTPNRIPVASMRGAKNIQNKIRYNALSELSFEFPNIEEAYSFIKNKMLIYVKGVGYYSITSCPEDNSGYLPIKKVTAKSIESTLIYRRLTGFEVTSVMLYNTSDEDDSLLDILLRYVPGWSIDYVDPLVLIDTDGNELRRGFEIDNTTLYSFLISKVESAYNCVFTFDAINKAISVYSISSLNNVPDIFISLNNIAQDIKVEEYSDELCTALYCFGGEDLDIQAVNPLGANVIYNFDYYKTTDWMSSDLITALDNWESKIDTYQPDYANKYTEMLNYQLDIASLNTELGELNAELEALIITYNTRKANKQNTDDVESKIDIKKVDISMKNESIADIQILIDGLLSDMRKMTDDLNFTTVDTFQSLIASLNIIYEDFVEISNDWTTLYSENSLAIEFDSEQLTVATPDINENFSFAFTKLSELTYYTKESLFDYSNITDDTIDVIKNYMEELYSYLDNLYRIFYNLIPNTSITIGLTTLKTLISTHIIIMDYEPNFTYQQWVNLQDFIFENTYTNENIFEVEDKGTEFNQTQAQSLYNQGNIVLDRISKPRYEIDGDFINIINLPEYSSIVENLELGKLVAIEIGDGVVVNSALLEINYTYDDPSSFNLVFSNKVRLNGSNFIFADMFIKSAESSSSVSGI